MTYKDDKRIGRKCLCADSNCPHCHGNCDNFATSILYRIDMEDQTGTAFCSDCADDALDAGVFTD